MAADRTHRTWAEIDLDAIAHNLREIRRHTDRTAQIMAVVKADAYGHGAPQVAPRSLGARSILAGGSDARGSDRAPKEGHKSSDSDPQRQ